nr:hypothetical protein [Tanacetum cinerariifolium]
QVGLDDHAQGLVTRAVDGGVGQREAEVGLRVETGYGGALRRGRRHVGGLDRGGPGRGPLAAAAIAVGEVVGPGDAAREQA